MTAGENDDDVAHGRVAIAVAQVSGPARYLLLREGVQRHTLAQQQVSHRPRNLRHSDFDRAIGHVIDIVAGCQVSPLFKEPAHAVISRLYILALQLLKDGIHERHASQHAFLLAPQRRCAKSITYNVATPIKGWAVFSEPVLHHMLS